MMKKLLLNTLMCLSLITAPVVILQTGCTTTQQRATYNTLYSVGGAVNSAYAGYNDAVVKGTATFNVNVAIAYNKFQATYNVAVQAASMNPNAIASQDIVDLANAVYAAIKQYTK